MAEFGTPQRSATSDANAGWVNPPAQTTVARTTQTSRMGNKQLSGVDTAVSVLGDAVGSILGNALQERLGKSTEETNSQRALDASDRQGIDTAINEVDKINKATGWTKSIFGENVEYRAAQQRAVQNIVQATYIEDLSKIDDYKGYTPKQYNKIQTAKRKSILDKYKDDPETQRLVQTELQNSGQKLAQQQYLSSYAYNQLQQQAVDRTHIQQSFDAYSLESKNLLTPEAKKAQLLEITKFINGGSRRAGKTKLAEHLQIVNVVQENMRKGNAGPMLAMQAAGLDKNFSPAEQAEWDKAMESYDGKFGDKADMIRITANLDMDSASTPEQVDAAVKQKDKDLTDLFNRSSGSLHSSMIIAKSGMSFAKDASVRAKAEASAVSSSDKNIIALIGSASEEMKQAIDMAETGSEKIAAMDTYYDKAQALAGNLSPSAAAILKKDKLDTAATSAYDALAKERARTAAKAAKINDKLAIQAKRDIGIDKYFSTSEPAIRGSLQSQFDFTKKDKQQGFDTYLVKGAQKFIGGDDLPTVEEFGQALQKDPKLQTWVLQEMKRNTATSPIIQTILSSAVGAPDRLFDKDGNVSQIGKDTTQMIDKLLESEKGISLIGGRDAYRAWTLMSRGIKSGAGKDFINKKVASYEQNKDKADDAGFSWVNITGDSKISRTTWMTGNLQHYGVEHPSPQMITNALHNYKQDMIAFGFDKREADNALEKSITENKTRVFNSLIYDAKAIEGATKWTTENFIKMADKYGFLKGKYGDLTGQKVAFSTQHDVPGLTWYTKPGVDAIFASAPSLTNELEITVDEMKDLEHGIDQQMEIDKNTAETRAEFVRKRRQMITQSMS